jgi:hypothetical protein
MGTRAIQPIAHLLQNQKALQNPVPGLLLLAFGSTLSLARTTIEIKRFMAGVGSPVLIVDIARIVKDIKERVCDIPINPATERPKTSP